MHIDKVIEAGSKFSKDTEEKLIQKMDTTLKNREEYLSNLLLRLKDHVRANPLMFIRLLSNKLNGSKWFAGCAQHNACWKNPNHFQTEMWIFHLK